MASHGMGSRGAESTQVSPLATLASTHTPLTCLGFSPRGPLVTEGSSSSQLRGHSSQLHAMAFCFMGTLGSQFPMSLDTPHRRFLCSRAWLGTLEIWKWPLLSSP